MHLRNHCDVWEARFQLVEVCERNGTFSSQDWEAIGLRVVELEQAVGQTNFVHDLHGRWMNGITTEVAVKVHVLLEQHYGYALACQQKGQNCTCRPTADDATGGLQGIREGCPYGFLCLRGYLFPRQGYIFFLHISYLQIDAFMLSGCASSAN